MECLRDYIGLRGCPPNNPESELYINSLPGISLASVDALANSEQATYAQVWADVQTRAIRRFTNAVNSELRKRFKLKSIRSSINIPKKVNVENITAAVAGDLRGFIVDLALSDDFTQSNLQCIYVQELWLWINTVPADDFKVQIYEMWHEDGYDDSKAFELTLDVDDLTTGWNRIPVNETFNSDKIFIGYEADDMISSELKLSDYIANQLCSSLSYVYGGCGGASITGAIANLSGDALNVSSTGKNTYGLSAMFSIQCRYDNLVCGDKNVFTTAFWYLLGVELQIERLHSTRINQWTMDRKEAEELRDFYQVEFEKELETACMGVDIDLNDACIDCNEIIKSVQNTP